MRRRRGRGRGLYHHHHHLSWKVFLPPSPPPQSCAFKHSILPLMLLQDPQFALRDQGREIQRWSPSISPFFALPSTEGCSYKFFFFLQQQQQQLQQQQQPFPQLHLTVEGIRGHERMSTSKYATVVARAPRPAASPNLHFIIYNFCVCLWIL